MNAFFIALAFALFFIESVPVKAQGVHCNFGGVNRFSKYNGARLAIMQADGIIVHSDIPARYNTSRRLVSGYVSVLATIRRDGTVTTIHVDKTSGDKSNDAMAMRLVRAASPFKIVPPYEGVLKIQFTPDGDVVSVFPVETKTEQPKEVTGESP